MVQTLAANNILIRKSIPSDMKFISEATIVVNGAYRSEGGWSNEKDSVSGLRCTEEDMAKFIKESGKPNTLLFAIQKVDNTETIVGTAQIQTSEEHPNEAEVGLISVSTTHQSGGIGGKLVRAAMEEMKILGFEYATMHVLENRLDILAWYKKLGFTETGERIPFFWPETLKVKDLELLTLKKLL